MHVVYHVMTGWQLHPGRAAITSLVITAMWSLVSRIRVK